MYIKVGNEIIYDIFMLMQIDFLLYMQKGKRKKWSIHRHSIHQLNATTLFGF